MGGGGGGGWTIMCPYPLKVQACPPQDHRLATQSSLGAGGFKEISTYTYRKWKLTTSIQCVGVAYIKRVITEAGVQTVCCSSSVVSRRPCHAGRCLVISSCPVKVVAGILTPATQTHLKVTACWVRTCISQVKKYKFGFGKIKSRN